jgi:putative ABC transport system permease protein
MCLSNQKGFLVLGSKIISKILIFRVDKLLPMNNLKFTFRMLKRNLILVFVGIPSLSAGLTVVLLLTVYLNHELSFDQHFATKDRVLRLYNEIYSTDEREVIGKCLRTAYTEIPSKVPEIEATTQLYYGWGTSVRKGEQQFSSMNLIYADPGFFDVFGLNLVTGRKGEALVGDGNVVLTRSAALRIFNNLDCVGQSLTISDKQFTVTGVMNDIPGTTHFNFDMLASIKSIHPEQFRGVEFLTYFLIRDRADVKVAGEKIVVQNNALMKPWGRELHQSPTSGTELLKDIHLYTPVNDDFPPKASLTNIIIVSGIAFFILMISMINYLVLYLLHVEKRVVEFASRKSSGATRSELCQMVYAETGMMVLFSFMLALVITLVVQPYFASLMQCSLSVSDFFAPTSLLMILAIMVLLIIFSGAYPSFYLSRINIVNGLKGVTSHSGRKNRASVVSVLVLFIVTAFLISSLMIIRSQVKFLKEIPLGFHSEQVIGIGGYTSAMSVQYKSIEDMLSRLSFVETVGSSHHFLGHGGSGANICIYGHPEDNYSINEYRVQPGFAETLKFEILNGRFFIDGESDNQSVILNEAAAKMLGLDQPIGVQVQLFKNAMTIIGVVKDFCYMSRPGDPIAPLVMTRYMDGGSICYMRVIADFNQERQNIVSSILKKYDPTYIPDYFHLSDVYSLAFRDEERVMGLVTFGAWLAILICFTGLMALSLIQVHRLTKEICIRKVLGSTVKEIVWWLVKRFVFLVVFSCIIAFGSSYYVIGRWLSHFPKKIPLSFNYFIISGLFILFIVLLSVGWQSWKAATKNPSECFKNA